MTPKGSKAGHRERRKRMCIPTIDDAGLPHRSDVLLERERRLYSAEVRRLKETGKRGKGSDLTVGMLEHGLESGDTVVQTPAAFLAGRSATDEPADRDWFAQLLHGLIDGLDPSNLQRAAGPYVEASMSLALLGEVDTARQLLLSVVAADQARATRGYLAAYYLAQLGDASGWPAMVHALHEESEHSRLMATRHLIAFTPYDGTNVDGLVVDVRAQFMERLRDPETYVSDEVPGLLDEAQLSAGA